MGKLPTCFVVVNKVSLEQVTFFSVRLDHGGLCAVMAVESVCHRMSIFAIPAPSGTFTAL